MEDYKVVYTLPDKRFFRYQLDLSLKTLRRFVPRENIVVIVNPPSESGYIKDLTKKITVIQGDEYYRELDLPKFKYKIEMCDIDTDNLIFLDCDTVVLKDITKLLDDDYDFYGREEPVRSVNNIMKPIWNEEQWEYLLNKFNKPLGSIPYNDGFIIFKNGIHKKIKEEYIKYYKSFNEHKITSPNSQDDMHHNEFSLSLAVAGYNCKQMNEDTHWFGWRAERLPTTESTYVLHVGGNNRGFPWYRQTLARHGIIG